MDRIREQVSSEKTGRVEGAYITAEMENLSYKARQDGGRYTKKRFVYSEIEKYSKERAFLALIGPRGVGKSVLLRQLHHASVESFYISLDAIMPRSLYEIANELLSRKTRLLLLDEIHAYPNYGMELKKIYDFLPDLQVIFTSSSAISLNDTSFDLSRRVYPIRIYPFSFREYLYFKHGFEIEALEWEALLDLEKSQAYYGKTLEIENFFRSYLKGGNYAFTMEQSNPLRLFEAMLNTVMEKDLVLPSRLTLAESYEAVKMMEFIGRSSAEGINYTSVAKNLGITPHKVRKYVELLERAYLLNVVLPKGTNLRNEPKILMAPPYRLLYKSYDDCVGALREDFFVDATLRLGVGLGYLKGVRGNKTPDYLLDKVICEVGGASKGRSQFKGIGEGKPKLIFTQPGKIDSVKRPLFFAGMLKERT